MSSNRVREFCMDTTGCFPAKCSRFLESREWRCYSLKDGKDHLIGSAIYNSKSQIVARRFSRRRQELDQDFFRRRIAQASEYRDRRNLDPKLRRVVWAKAHVFRA